LAAFVTLPFSITAWKASSWRSG